MGRPVPKNAEWCGEARAPSTQDGFASSQEVLLEQNPPKQNSFTANIFLPCPCYPELTQVCCCLHNPGEETEPLSAETSGAKACGWTDTPSWFSVPWSLVGQGAMESLG